MGRPNQDAKWLEDYNQAKLLCDEVFNGVQERVRIQKGGAETSKLSVQLRTKLEQLSNQISTLDSKLAVADPKKMTEKEISRRTDLLANLSNRRDQLVRQLQSVRAPASETSRSMLLPGGNGPSAGRASARIDGSETDDTRALGSRDVLTLQKTMLDQQDNVLDALSASVGRTKEVSIAINDELSVHQKLLGELTDGVDRTQGRMEATGKKMKRVFEMSKQRWAYCTMIMLICALVVVLLIALGWIKL
eukprot:tig00001604_g9404.t1